MSPCMKLRLTSRCFHRHSDSGHSDQQYVIDDYGGEEDGQDSGQPRFVVRIAFGLVKSTSDGQ
jgi:hypothetical protein